MKDLNSIVSGSGILKSHEEFLERLGDLMNEYGFDSVYADGESQKVVFDNSKDGSMNATEGLAFGTLRDGSFLAVDSFFSYHNNESAQYSRQDITSEEQDTEGYEPESEPEAEPEEKYAPEVQPKKQSKSGKTWGQSGA